MKEKAFIGYTFLISWGIEIALMATGHTKDGMFDLLYPLIMLAPALAVLITKYTVKEPLWVHFWLRPDGRKTMRYTLLGWIGPFILILLGGALYFIWFRDAFDWKMSEQIQYLRDGMDGGLKEFTDEAVREKLMLQIVLNVLFAPLYNLFTCVGEEVGWRGYFLNMLCEKHPKWRAVLINGLTWGIWYFPLVMQGMFYGKSYPGYPVTGCLAVLVYCVALGSIYSFLTLKTNSCIPAIFANACFASMNGMWLLFMKGQSKADVFVNPTITSPVGGWAVLAVAAVIFAFLAEDRVQPAEPAFPVNKRQVVQKPKKGKKE